MNPYSKYLGERNALEVLQETPQILQNLAGKIGAEGMKRSWAEGKWTAGELILHLIQVEFAHGNRIRYALTTENYTVQPFEQDEWVKREAGSVGVENIQFLIGLRNFNLQLFRTITEEEKSRPVTHPELGELSLGDLLDLLAGSDLNHQRQLEIIANSQKTQAA